MQISPTARRWLLGALAGGILTGAAWRNVSPRQPENPAPATPIDRTAPVARPPATESEPASAEASVANATATLSGVLFSFAEPSNAAELTAALPAPSREVRYVRINRALLTGKQSPFWQKPGAGRIEIPLPRGGSLDVRIDSSEMLGPDRFTSFGRIAGREHSRVVFAATAGFLQATIEDPLLGSFALRVATDELSQFYRVEPELVANCGGERTPPARSASAPAASTDFFPAAPAVAAAENPQRAEIHVMMAHTTAVLPTMSGAARTAALQSAFDAAIAKVNAAFEASLITARLKLVRVHETALPGDEQRDARTGWQDDALTGSSQSGDGLMEDIHAARDQSGADIVCLALQRADVASSGLSFLLTPDRSDNAEYAFSVVQYGNIAGTNVVAHEMGHVLGCAHDRQNALSGEGAYSYSFGYRFVGGDGRQYHDIMSYPPGTELSYFSNPNVFVSAPVNAAIGIAAGRSGESNTALTIEQTAFLTATYRLQTQALPNPGALINVATRAYVGSGDEVLIGGFVVGGTQAKRVLVRGVGPRLATFGVTNALSDPVVRVNGRSFAGVAVSAENDNWSGADVAAAAAQVGAFALDSGSADAALLVTLQPGAYTAVVEGIRGTVGSGLVEVYDLDRSGNRIINLATRGYADRQGKEMYGGFVVQGAAGTTKRILVRVLGPTLTRVHGIPGTLDDPFMEIRNGVGELLVANDDWSSDSEGGVSPETDFSPAVVTYGEKQIFATGRAPGNRREPCVLVDLPPGAYTVVVTPFEQRSSNPLVDQPAVPGVGIVEVYEIER